MVRLVSTYLIVILQIVSIISVSSYIFDESKYTNSTWLSPDNYRLHWKVNHDTSTIYLAFEVKTAGWLGFGIAEPTSGSMPGSDIVTGYIVNGTAHIQDRHAMEKALPAQDECVDWVLINGTEINVYDSNTDQNNTWTIIEVSRLLDTKDKQDRVIVAGLNRIVFAYGYQDTVGYHSDRRKGTAVTFWEDGDTISLDDLQISATGVYTSQNYSIKPVETDYACTSFILPYTAGEQHVIMIEPLIDPASAKYVHHFFLHQCQNDSWYAQYLNGTQSCDSFTIFEHCNSHVWAWAPGMGPFFLPKEAGIRVGANSSSLQFLLLEVHYNNPSFDKNQTDSSGVRFSYTKELRLHDASALMIGDVATTSSFIEPGLEAKEYEYSCPSHCTAKFPHDIQLFSIFSHMHQLGSEIWTTQWRGNTKVDELGRIEFYDFGYQQSVPLRDKTLKMGDRLNLHCVYNSKERSTRTAFGTDSDEEMCMAFISYYPRLESYSMCGYLGTKYGVLNACGNTLTSIAFGPNPEVVDPIGGINKTFGINCSDVIRTSDEEHVDTDTNNEKKRENTPLIAGVAGGVGGAIVLVGIIVAVSLSRRKNTDKGTPVDSEKGKKVELVAIKTNSSTAMVDAVESSDESEESEAESDGE